VSSGNFGDFLLEVGYQTFALKRSYFDRLSQKEWSNAGIENWVQIELIMSFLTRSIPVTVIGKGKKDCDLIVRGHAVELRCATAPVSFWLLDAIKKHPRAEYYFFLSRSNSKLVFELTDYFNKNGYSEKHKMLTENWMIMVVTKNKEMLSSVLEHGEKLPEKPFEPVEATSVLQRKVPRHSTPASNKDAFYEKLGAVNPELRASFQEIIRLVDDLWKGTGRYKFPYNNTIDYRTSSSRTVVSILLQTRLNRLIMYLKFGEQRPNDPAKLTDDVSRFGFGKLNRRLYFDPSKDKIGGVNEVGSVANLLKQVRDINP
jgi:hypothetical protein